MNNKYKSPVKKLLKYFESSRDKWRERSSKYQSEKRKLLFSNNDLKKNRDKWKQTSIDLAEENERLKLELSKVKKKT